MAYVITQKCVGTCDTACVDVCPCDCIVGPVPLDQLRAVPEAERGSRFPGIQMFVDPDECIDCGACTAECPVAAIYLDEDVPTEHRGDIEANARFFRRKLLEEHEQATDRKMASIAGSCGSMPLALSLLTD